MAVGYSYAYTDSTELAEWNEANQKPFIIKYNTDGTIDWWKYITIEIDFTTTFDSVIVIYGTNVNETRYVAVGGVTYSNGLTSGGVVATINPITKTCNSLYSYEGIGLRFRSMAKNKNASGDIAVVGTNDRGGVIAYFKQKTDKSSYEKVKSITNVVGNNSTGGLTGITTDTNQSDTYTVSGFNGNNGFMGTVVAK